MSSTSSPRYILFGIFLYVISSHAAIFSSHHHKTRSLNEPKVMSLSPNENEIHKPNSFLNKIRQYLTSRQKRGVMDKDVDPHTSNNLQASWIDLGNETTHNQALIHWTGNNSNVIFILTRKKDRGSIVSSTLHRSADYGKTFRPVNNFSRDTILKEYVVSPTNKGKVIFIDTFQQSSRLWVSKDEGMSYQQHRISFSMDKIEFHPDQEDWMLGYDKKAESLYVSMDLGSTWTKLHDMVTKDRYYWYVKGVDAGPDANKVVFFEHRNMKVFPARSFLLTSCYVPHCLPTPFQKMSESLGRIDAESLVVQDDFVFVQKTGLLQKFYVSYNRGPFKKAEFPLDGEQVNFHVVSSDWSTVILGVNHNLGITNLYFSDTEGKKFTLSLSDVRTFESKVGDNMIFNVDIHKVAGVRGAYLVNKVDPIMSTNKTYRTWDNGKTWDSLFVHTSSSCKTEPGSYDYILYGPDACRLNLHCSMVQTQLGYYIPGMLSKESVPGLVVAHGSIGHALSDKPSTVQVWVSQDAGATWTKGPSGRHLYAMGDHGAMLVAASMIFKKPIKTIQFSKDLGATWTEHQFIHTNSSVHPDGLLTEPGEYTHHFTLFTHENYLSNWRIFAMDMSSLILRSCVYPADFSNFTMPPKHKDRYIKEMTECHLGRIDTVERVLSHDCLIGPDYKMKTRHQICNCTESDYECTYGYTLTRKGECKSVTPVIDWVEDIPHIVAEEPEVGECIDGQKKLSTNFRRIPGDQCKHDLPGKIYTFEECTNETKPESVVLRLVNITSSAKVGQGLLITVQGPSNVQWVVTRRSEPPVNISIQHPKNQKDTVALTPNIPGDYEVRAYYKDKPDIYDDLVVSFWYPIEEVVVVLPPSVEVGSFYNATALVVSKSGIPVTYSDFGNINYIWEGDIQGDLRSSDFIRTRHSKVGRYNLVVQASNSVSYKKGRGRVVVKPHLVTLFLTFVPSQPINKSVLTHGWLKDMEYIILAKLMAIKGFSDLLSLHHLALGVNWQIFIDPTIPLRAQLIFLPNVDGIPLRDHLRLQATDFLKLIKQFPIAILLSPSNRLTQGDVYIMSNNQRYDGASSTNYVAIVFVVLLVVVVLLVGAVLVGRRYARNSRWGRYFTMPGPSSMDLPPIIRPKGADCAPIVVEDEEFFDDDLDTMEDIASSTTGGGTLAFRS